jgi:preprotein translocase subunit SecD
MPKTLRWKWILIGVVLLTCVIGVIGLPKSGKELFANWEKNIRLGLDLKGGSHIVLQIQVQDAFKVDADMAIESLKEALTNAKIGYASIDHNDPGSLEAADSIEINLRGLRTGTPNELNQVVNQLFAGRWILSSSGIADYKLNISKEAALQLRQETLTQSMSTMERKINGLGVAETSIQQRGGRDGAAEILIQLPGVDDPARVKGILQTAALLELCEVMDGPFSSSEEALGRYGGVLPFDAKIVRGTLRAADGIASENWWVLRRSPIITGRDLRDARAQSGEMPGHWETSFMLRRDAAQRFERFTEANINNRLAIVLDNMVLSAPRIESRISDQGRITGAATREEALDLAVNLRAGSLPASAKLIEERTVGPSLGADSIRQGITAGIVGLALVVASMLLYYRGAGLNAVMALLLNTIITIAALSYFESTWTLPGIAGLVLSIGMAVDSNVLIFERVKEEMRGGKRVPAAISAGFDRALLTIIDTHVTTVVASAFLFVFGTGPVRGFAVTLVIGLLANLFTALFVSRAIFDVHIWRRPKLESISIGSRIDRFGRSSIDFLRRSKLTLALSMLMLSVSLTSMVVYGLKPGLDFRGGTLIYVKFLETPKIDELRQVLSSRLPGEIAVQQTRAAGEFIIGTALSDENSLDQARLAVEETLRDTYADLGGRLDLNNANQAALESRFRAALPAAGLSIGEQELKNLAERILRYRDQEKGGLINSVDELTIVPGVDQSVLRVIKDQCGLGSFNIRSVEIVGPRAGEELRRQAVMATFGAFGGMLVYIAFRFKLISGVAAILATLHDVVITLGFFSLTDREISLNIIAALLTLIGYSMNDKIVVFDRVRENVRLAPKGTSFLQLVNQSINQTLSRTILTAGPTLLACLALYFLGGEVLNGIAFALFIGIVVGTYSSICVASSLLVMWNDYRSDLAKASVPARS